MKRHLFSLLVVLCAAAFASGQETTRPRPLPGGGVADPSGKVGFFPNTSGGIDALDLATGKVLWTSKDANRPLLATENRLYAQAGKSNQVRIVALDLRNEGATILESKPIQFPGWVSVDVAYGRSFRSGARMDAKGLYLTWEARAFYAGGARPTPQIEKAARQEASGVARVDLEDGKVEMLDAEKTAAGKFFPIPGDAINPKVGALTLTITDGTPKNPKKIFERRRTLNAINEAKEMVWQHDIAAPVFLPPRP